jgi:hypothetical protein
LKLTKSAPGREELGSHASKVADRAFHGGAKTEATGKIRQGCSLPQDRLMQLPSSLQSQRLRGWVIARLALEPLNSKFRSHECGRCTPRSCILKSDMQSISNAYSTASVISVDTSYVPTWRHFGLSTSHSCQRPVLRELP